MNKQWERDIMRSKQNGWYTTFNVMRKTREGKITLSLWRDGQWIDILQGTDIMAYNPDLVMRDTKGYATINDAGALRLATEIVRGICDNYKTAFRKACNVTDEDSDIYRRNLDYRVFSLRKLIRSQYFCNLSLGLVDSDKIIDNLEKQAMEGT